MPPNSAVGARRFHVSRVSFGRLVAMLGVVISLSAFPVALYGQGNQQPEGVWNKATIAAHLSSNTPPTDDATNLLRKTTSPWASFLSAAEIEERAGRIDQADEAYRQAIHLDSNRLDTLLAYARFKNRQNCCGEALRIYGQLVKDHPREASVFNDLGMHHLRRREIGEAAVAFGRAIELRADKPLYRNNMAQALVLSGQLDGAMVHLRAVYTEAEACYKLGFLLQSCGQTESAAVYFRRAFEANPQMAEARMWANHLGELHASVGQTDYVVSAPARAPHRRMLPHRWSALHRSPPAHRWPPLHRRVGPPRWMPLDLA